MRPMLSVKKSVLLDNGFVVVQDLDQYVGAFVKAADKAADVGSATVGSAQEALQRY